MLGGALHVGHGADGDQVDDQYKVPQLVLGDEEWDEPLEATARVGE